MTWFKVDDQLHAHRKVAELESGKHFAEAIALWTLAGSWCASQLADGAVPASQLRRLVPFDARKAAAELVRVGLWEVTETGYRFRSWHEYQPSRDSVESRRAATTDRVRRHRDRTKQRDCNALHGENARDGNAALTPPPIPIPIPIQSATHSCETARVSHADVTALFGRLRSEAHQAKTGQPGGTYRRTTRDWQPIEDLVAWANDQADPAGALDDSLRGFLANEWAIEAGWPVSAWAKDPGKYMGRAGGSASPRQSAIAVAEAAVVVAKEAYERSYGTEQRDECRRAYDATKARLARLRLSAEAAS